MAEHENGLDEKCDQAAIGEEPAADEKAVVTDETEAIENAVDAEEDAANEETAADDSADEKTSSDAEANEDASAEPEQKKRLGRGKIAAICVVALVVVAVAVFAGFATGVMKPGDAAAKYNLISYITETETTEYIEIYKEQMGYGEGTDDKDWATFLAAYNMTPERLRASTIDQLLTDKIVQERCDSLGISVSDEELNQAIEYYKAMYASGSDEIWKQTLDQVSQTEEGFAKNLKLTMLKQKLVEDQVPNPEPTDEQVVTAVQMFIASAIANDQSLTLKHTYCFKKSKSSSDGSMTEREDVEKIRQSLIKAGLTKENFAAVVSEHCDDENLKANSGANGWNADTSGYSEEYLKTLSSLGDGELSSVFADDSAYYFIWVSDTYKLPKNRDKFTADDLEKMPSSLHDYFSDYAAYTLWQTSSQQYLATITEGVDLQIFEMPADVPYNVDMSLANNSAEGDAAESADASTAESTGASTQ